MCRYRSLGLFPFEDIKQGTKQRISTKEGFEGFWRFLDVCLDKPRTRTNQERPKKRHFLRLENGIFSGWKTSLSQVGKRLFLRLENVFFVRFLLFVLRFSLFFLRFLLFFLRFLLVFLRFLLRKTYMFPDSSLVVLCVDPCVGGYVGRYVGRFLRGEEGARGYGVYLGRF